jgi:hypothetical protein
MQFTESRLNAAIETAKARAAGNRALLNAIEKAAIGLRGAWVVSELRNAMAVTTESGATYYANGTCGCAAYQSGMVCKHRVTYRVVALYHSAEAATSRVVRTVEYQHSGARLEVTRCDGWLL